MDPRWTQNGPKMDPKWTQHGPKMDPQGDTHISAPRAWHTYKRGSPALPSAPRSPMVSSRHLQTGAWLGLCHDGWYIFEDRTINKQWLKTLLHVTHKGGCRSTWFSSCTSSTPSHTAFCSFRSLSTNTDRWALINSSAGNLHHSELSNVKEFAAAGKQLRVRGWPRCSRPTSALVRRSSLWVKPTRQNTVTNECSLRARIAHHPNTSEPDATPNQ